MLLDENGNIWDEVEFENEEALESIVFKHHRLLYGDQALLFKKAIIKTEDGKGTIPDGYVVDLDAREWYIVEVELLHHGVYDHIVPQITKQANAASTSAVKAILRQSFLAQIQDNEELKKTFTEAEIPDIEIPGVIESILNKQPRVSLPIDNVSPDLFAWAQTLKYAVEVKHVVCYRNRSDGKVMLQFPGIEDRAAVGGDVTEEVNELYALNGKDLILKLLDTGILKVGQELYMRYKKKEFTAIVTDTGQLELPDRTRHSASLAAIKCVQSITKERDSANGLAEWKSRDGKALRDLRRQLFQGDSE